MAKPFAKSGDPEQAPFSVASDLDLHCLSFTLLEVSDCNGLNYTSKIFNTSILLPVNVSKSIG